MANETRLERIEQEIEEVKAMIPDDLEQRIEELKGCVREQISNDLQIRDNLNKQVMGNHRETIKRIEELESEVKIINATQPFGEHVLSLRDDMRKLEKKHDELVVAMRCVVSSSPSMMPCFVGTINACRIDTDALAREQAGLQHVDDAFGVNIDTAGMTEVSTDREAQDDETREAVSRDVAEMGSPRKESQGAEGTSKAVEEENGGNKSREVAMRGVNGRGEPDANVATGDGGCSVDAIIADFLGECCDLELDEHTSRYYADLVRSHIKKLVQKIAELESGQ